tara:strand:+ start:556 stop:987 length:432 start_codon:yes stop_codon:yes gene_type:complete
MKNKIDFLDRVKKMLENSNDKYLISNYRGSKTKELPGCIVFNKSTGLFTLELQIIQPDGYVYITPWTQLYGEEGASALILVYMGHDSHVKLFPGTLSIELKEKGPNLLPSLYEGDLDKMDLKSTVASSMSCILKRYFKEYKKK